ncbi:aspartyl-phosphate phosphatase Spo0E family protein [Paenibacillus sp. LjRoot153]|uniref:aspartyl-phosphate phosphatase Spo0E family protein n=1 Tax=Paenibacillus sp. LjRoot153 TaxID=3342270 RepID=UPI003F509303
MNLSDIEQEIEILRSDMVQMFLIGNTMSSVPILELSEKLDVMINFYYSHINKKN